jgi:hypothetical protein
MLYQYSSIAKIFYLPEYSKKAKLAKFIRFEAICEAANFLSQSSRRTVDVFLFLRAPSNIKEVVQYSSIAKIFYFA